MLLGGLCHGANWVFLIWGGYHGLLLAVERASKGTPLSSFMVSLPMVLRVVGVFLLVTIGWVFFRSPDLSFAILWLKQMFAVHPTFSLFYFEPQFRDRFFAALVVAIGISFFGKNNWEIDFEKLMKPSVAWVAAVLMVVCLAFFSKNSPFLYFQF